MFTATADIQVRRPITEVFAFVEDARNRPQWDDTVISEEITSAPPITVGTTVRTRLRSMGREYTYTWVVTDHDVPGRMTIESVSGPLPTTLQFTLTGDVAQTRVEFTVTGRPTGFMRLLQPMMARSTKHNLDRNCERLGRLLETGSGSSSTG
ncbi:MAG: SRPBCC family protein [Cryobacterium sp.]|nr:SRPBCC family protein [Cryobacterium sp.]